MRDDPMIRNIERWGHPFRHSEYPICPECLEECETVYKDSEGNIVGCDRCLTEREAWDEEACFPNRGRDYD